MTEQALVASEQARAASQVELTEGRAEAAALRREAAAAREGGRREAEAAIREAEEARVEAGRAREEVQGVTAQLERARAEAEGAMAEAERAREGLAEARAELEGAKRQVEANVESASAAAAAHAAAQEAAAAASAQAEVAAAAAGAEAAAERERHSREVTQLRRQHQQRRSQMEARLNAQVQALQLSVQQWQQQQQPAPATADVGSAAAASEEERSAMVAMATEVAVLRHTLHLLGLEEPPVCSPAESAQGRGANTCPKTHAPPSHALHSHAPPFPGGASGPAQDLADVRALRLDAQLLLARREADAERLAALELAARLDEQADANAALSLRLAEQRDAAERAVAEVGRAARRQVRALQAQLHAAGERLAAGDRAQVELAAATEATRAKARALRLSEEALADVRRGLAGERSERLLLEKQLSEARGAAEAAEARAAKARADLRAREPLLREARAKLAAVHTAKATEEEERSRLMERAARAEADAKAKERLLADTRRRLAEAEASVEPALAAAVAEAVDVALRRAAGRAEASVRPRLDKSDAAAADARRAVADAEARLARLRMEHAEALADASDRDAECRRLSAEADAQRTAAEATRHLLSEFVRQLHAAAAHMDEGGAVGWHAGGDGDAALDEARQIELLSSSLLQLPASELGFFTPSAPRAGGGGPWLCGSPEDALSVARTTAASVGSPGADVRTHGGPHAGEQGRQRDRAAKWGGDGAGSGGGDEAAAARELHLLLDGPAPLDVPRACRLLWRLVRALTPPSAPSDARSPADASMRQALGSYDAMLCSIKGQVAAEHAQAARAIAERDNQIGTLRRQLAAGQATPGAASDDDVIASCPAAVTSDRTLEAG
jgi:hypothetical protein